MKHFSIFFISVFSLLILTMCEQDIKVTETTIDTSKPPTWAKNAIWYQIFVERFNNGDPLNDPISENMYASTNWRQTPENWSLTPWTWNWYKQEEWTKDLDTDFYGGLGLRRFGGDLQGIFDKLDHLQELGITAIYFNPLNDAPSLNKYQFTKIHP